MIDSFYLGAYWGARHEDLDKIVELTLATLYGLGNIDVQFTRFYEQGGSRKQALERLVILEESIIGILYKKGIKKQDIDFEGKVKLGYSLTLWNGQKEGESATVSFTVGGISSRFSNLCLINLPYENPVKDRLLTLETIKTLAGLIIDNWDPDSLKLSSTKLSETLGGYSETGWVTYKKQLTKKPKVSRNIVHESNYKGGHLFYLKTESGLAYDYDMMEDLKVLKDSL